MRIARKTGFLASRLARKLFGVAAVNRAAQHDQTTDAAIAGSAEHWLGWNPSLAMTDIHVSVHNGCVTLAGEVSWDYQRIAAEATIRHLVGISTVRNELQVGLRSGTEKNTVSSNSKRKTYVQVSSFADLRGMIGANSH